MTRQQRIVHEAQLVCVGKSAHQYQSVISKIECWFYVKTLTVRRLTPHKYNVSVLHQIEAIGSIVDVLENNIVRAYLSISER